MHHWPPFHNPMAHDTIIVNNSGTLIMYTDMGAPSQSQYSTQWQFMGWVSLAFRRSLSRKAHALNRRNYPGSTPYNEEEIDMLVNGTKEQKDDWHCDRGHELGTFIYKLIDKGKLPPISADRKTGGMIVVGWSAGAGDAIGTIAHTDLVMSDFQKWQSIAHQVQRGSQNLIYNKQRASESDNGFKSRLVSSCANGECEGTIGLKELSLAEGDSPGAKSHSL